MNKRILLCFLMILCQAPLLQAKLITYPAPIGSDLRNDFTVRVRQAGGEWKTVDTYSVNVAKVVNCQQTTEKASLGYFDFSGVVEVAVTYNHGSIHIGRIRPLSYGIVPIIKGNAMTFKLDRPQNLSVEVNGDIFHNLHLFANPIDTYQPNLKDSNLIYFAPGIYQLPNDTLKVKSGKTVYIAGGAVLKGCIVVSKAHDVKILGRGIVHKENGLGIRIAYSHDVVVDGVITTTCPVGGSDNVTINNVKAISSFGWGDGMNVFASNNVFYDGVFCRNSDDCTTVYATRLGFVGGCKHIVMQNSTLWADVAHPIFIGLHGNVDDPNVIEDLSYKNIDILDENERQIDYQGCMAINAGDDNLVRNVRFEDIRIEDIRCGQLLDLRVSFNHKYCKAPGRGIENVLFKNITYNGSHAELSLIAGYDDQRMVKDIRFENFKVNGVAISDDMPVKPKWYKTGDMARIFIGEHVDNITFK